MQPSDLGDEQYINISNTRKDGREVKTPVWAAKDGERIVVWTNVNSGKVKRIRRTGVVRIAACDFRGTMPLTFGPAPGHGFIALDLRLRKEKKPGMCTPQRTASGNIVVTTQGNVFRFSIPGTTVSGSGSMQDNQVKGTWIVEAAGVKTAGAFLLEVREPTR